MKKLYAVFVAFFILLIYTGCGEKKINRDYIPMLKENLYKLQVAVKDKNIVQIDSLLSVKILSKKQGSDSLLRFIYGRDNSFDFVQFGNAEIVYTNKKARIDCYVMDSTSSSDRPIVFFLEYDHDLWLFTSFTEKSDTDKLKLD